MTIWHLSRGYSPSWGRDLWELRKQGNMRPSSRWHAKRYALRDVKRRMKKAGGGDILIHYPDGQLEHHSLESLVIS